MSGRFVYARMLALGSRGMASNSMTRCLAASLLLCRGGLVALQLPRRLSFCIVDELPLLSVGPMDFDMAYLLSWRCLNWH